jgi:hypothetical protein
MERSCTSQQVGGERAYPFYAGIEHEAAAHQKFAEILYADARAAVTCEVDACGA